MTSTPSKQAEDAVPEDDGALPALYDHCLNTYHEMLRQATTVIQPKKNVDDEDEEAGSIVVYEGYLTHLVTKNLRLSVPYYTTIRQNLIRMGCIRQLKRGGGSSKSQWELIYEPTEEAFLKNRAAKRPKQRREDAFAEQIRNLSARVSELEDWKEAINDTLVENFGVEPEEEAAHG